jgi:hypothetical protein
MADIVERLRYGWPRRILIRIPDRWMSERVRDALNDWLYPSDMAVHIERKQTR